MSTLPPFPPIPPLVSKRDEEFAALRYVAEVAVRINGRLIERLAEPTRRKNTRRRKKSDGTR